MLTLPEPSTERLSRSPLSLVVCQVRHERTLAAADPKRAVAVHDALREQYPDLEEQAAQDLTVQAGPLGLQALPGELTRGWRMRSKDEKWTLVIMPDFFSIETTQYFDWEDFRSRLEAFTRSIFDSIGPALEQRVGLRFIDRVSHPEVGEPRDWQTWIDASFLGPILHPSLGPGVENTQQIVQLDTGDGRSAIIRHGCFRDQTAGGGWIYTIDHDCFAQRSQTFDPDGVLETAEGLHTLALQVFQGVITPELFDYLKDKNGSS